MVPAIDVGGQINLNVNVIIVQKANGTGNFDINNSTHLAFLNSLYSHNNNVLSNWLNTSGNCPVFPSGPLFRQNLNITLIPNYVIVKNDYYANHGNDPNPTILNTYNKSFLNSIVSLASLQPNYKSNASDVILTEGPNIYNGQMYASITNDAYSNTRRLITHNPRLFENYNYKLSLGQDPFTTLNDIFYTFLHELFHHFTLQGNQNSCASNIMCGTSCVGDARNQIAGCQEARIYKSLMGYFHVKTVDNFSSFLDHNAELTQNTTLNQEVAVFSQLVIKTGTTLTINSNGIINMAKDRRIVVERGAKLVINGGKIRALGPQWKGIIVEGSSLGQNTHLSNPLIPNQSGVVYVYNGGVIEGAKDAIAMDAYHIAWPNTPNYYGGYAYLNNAVINNCNRGLAFMQYARNGNKDLSKITNSSFYNTPYGITIWADDGVIIENTLFNCNQDGVYSLDAQVFVRDNCRFNNCANGIFLNGTINYSYGSEIGIGGMPNVFTTCNKSIRIQSQNTAASLLVSNNIVNGGYQGIYLDGASNYYISDNTISVSEQAIRCIATGNTSTNIISDNLITGGFNGIHYSGNNSGVRYLRNCFQSIITSAIYGSSGASAYSIQGNGSCSADNCFNNGSTPAYVNYGSLVTYVHNPNYVCTYPNNSVNINYNSSSSCSYIDPCSSQYLFIQKENIYTENVLLQKLEEFRIIEKKDGQAQEEKIKMKNERYTLYQEYIKLKTKDAEPELDRIVELLDNEEDFQLQILSYGLRIQQGNLNGASNYLNLLKPVNKEQIDYIFAQKLYLEFLKGPNKYKLTENDYTRLLDNAKIQQPLYGHTRAILFVLTGTLIEFETENQLPVLERNKDIQNAIQFDIFPNPLSNIFNIEIQNTRIASFNIYSIHGELVYKQVIENGNFNGRVDLSDKPKGIYYLKTFDLNNQQIMETKPLIKL
ncbi:MAG: T9SS type A sorting domain-containing protein [Saprospiraceae bacterium]|nr:T9SS type A sorting domain-containing protein [Saprospiraceae bacterium]